MQNLVWFSLLISREVNDIKTSSIDEMLYKEKIP